MHATPRQLGISKRREETPDPTREKGSEDLKALVEGQLLVESHGEQIFGFESGVREYDLLSTSSDKYAGYRCRLCRVWPRQGY